MQDTHVGDRANFSGIISRRYHHDIIRVLHYGTKSTMYSISLYDPVIYRHAWARCEKSVDLDCCLEPKINTNAIHLPVYLDVLRNESNKHPTGVN